MEKLSITLKGILAKPPKIREDGSADLIFKNTVSMDLPKDIRPSPQDTNILARVRKKDWNRIAKKVNEQTFFTICGYPRALKTKSGIPFIEITTTNILINNKVIAAKQQEAQQEEEEKKEEKEKRFKWWNDEEVKEVDVNSIYITEEEHLNCINISYFGLLKHIRSFKETYPIAVRPIEDNKYALVMGMKVFTAAKIMNREKMNVILVDKNYNELVDFIEDKKHGIQ